MLNKMESKENFYFVHLAKELDLIKCANNNTCISLIPLHSCSITCDVISKKYHITYKNMFFFDFKLITTREPIKTSIVKQNTIICEINTEETINNFVKKCEKFVLKVYEDYQKIKYNYYIRDFTFYLDKIFIKNITSNKNLDYIEIDIMFEGIYVITVSNVLLETYMTLEELIESNCLSVLRRTYFRDFLYMIGLL